MNLSSRLALRPASLLALFALAEATACATPTGADMKPMTAMDAPAASNETGPDPKSFFPLAPGAEWTYEAKSGGKKTTDTIRIVGKDGAWFLDDHRGKVRFEADGVRDHDRYLLRAPLVTGKSWTAVDNMVVQRFDVVSTDAKVVCGAGTFDHVVVVRNDQALPNGSRFVTEWSYAPNVGLVQMRTTTVAGAQSIEQVSIKLMSFKAGN